MSRVPRPAVSNSNLRSQYRAPITATPRKPTSPNTQTRLRPPGAATAKSRPTSPSPRKHIEEKEEPPKERLSLKEQIALKRAEAKKAQATPKNAVTSTLDDGPDAIPIKSRKGEDDLLEIGRLGIRETVERARSTGNLNISSRSLPCIPSCLFEVHLGVTPKPLDSVTEPEYPEDDTPKRSRQNRQQPSWFEAQDLVVLKARTNDIVAIQPELSLFGSLKVIDLHSNQIKSLPASLTILASLTTLDLSSNNLAEIPPPLFSLLSLAILDLSNNQLTTLPFSRFNDPLDLPKTLSIDGFYQPEVSRANEPLPNLHTLDVGHNKLTAAAIDASHLPRSIIRITLAHNPLGQSRDLVIALAKLEHLQDANLEHASIKDESFLEPPSDAFPKLQLLDLSETRVTEQAIRSFFANSRRSNALNFSVTTAPPSPGELRVSVGKRIIREAWEIEADQRFLRKKKSFVNASANVGTNASKETAQVEKEPWEMEAEQGLMTEGGRRRARAAGAAASSSTSSLSAKQMPGTRPTPAVPPPRPLEKEPWEIEAEQGLLTEAGRRRLRAQQSAPSGASPNERQRKSSSPSGPHSLESSKYYSASTLTLTLPPSAPPNRSHARAFSTLAMPQYGRTAEDLLVPAPTLPLAVILQQDFAAKLQVLNLSNRRADPTFSFPSLAFLATAQISGGILPRLSELILDGCALGDMVSVSHEADDGGAPTMQKRGLLEVITETFPWLTLLDLSYNTLTSDGLSPTVIERLLVPSDGRKGLKILRLRGNRLSSLEAFEQVAELFRGNRQVPNWGFEELDVRDNEISKLPPLLGLVPMDVFLVDGNVFRVPPRKVWEREGTKGLLGWLRGRIE